MRAPTACRRTVSGTISLFCSKCFSPFPHGTGSLSVSREYLALPDGPGGFTQDSSCPALLRIPLRFIRVHVRSCHALWRHFPEPSIPLTPCDGAVLLPRLCRNTAGLGCSPFARHYWGRLCAPPRGFSQLVTSFIASESLGIRRAPFLTSGAAQPLRGGGHILSAVFVQASLARTLVSRFFIACHIMS